MRVQAGGRARAEGARFRVMVEEEYGGGQKTKAFRSVGLSVSRHTNFYSGCPEPGHGGFQQLLCSFCSFRAASSRAALNPGNSPRAMAEEEWWWSWWTGAFRSVLSPVSSSTPKGCTDQ